MKTTGRKWWLAVVALSLTLVACNKEDLIIPEANDPVFEAAGTIGTEPFKIVAGDDGAYMHTMTLEDNGVSVFTGRISKDNFSLEMGIYDGYLDNPTHHTAAELLNIDPRFADGNTKDLVILSKDLLMTLDQSQFIEKIDWFVNGEWKGENEAPIHDAGVYEVCAQILFFGGSEATLCNEVVVGYELSANCRINFEMGEQGMTVANIYDMGNPVQEVQWSVDGVYQMTQPNFSGNVGQGFHTLSARVKFQNGSIRTKNVLVNGSQSYFTANDFTIFEINGSTAHPPRDFNIRLSLEKDGKKYSSMSADNDGSIMSITNVEYYGPNDQGNDVYKIKAVVSAKLKELGTLKIVPITFTTSFGVEIK